MVFRGAVVAGLVLSMLAAAGSPASAATATTVEAMVRLEDGVIVGAATATIENSGPAPLGEAVFLLYPDRFRGEPAAMDDLARHHLLWSGGYRPGGLEVRAVRVAGRPVSSEVVPAGDAPARLRVPLDPALDPGERLEVTIDFRTRLPNLRDVFGARDGLTVAATGWFPVALEDGEPAAGEVRLTLGAPAGAEVLFAGRRFRGGERIDARGPLAALAPWIVSTRPIESVERHIGARRVVVHRVPSFELAHRVGRSPPPAAALDAALDVIVPRLRDEEDVVVIRAPLGWIPTWSSPGAVIVSDRLFEIFPELRPLHARELAYAVFLAEERRAVRPGEPAWVAEGLAWRRAAEVYEELRHGREVREWIRLFDVFAIVDRFETAPRIPLARPFFPVRASDDALGLRFPGDASAAPPGRILFDEIERRLGAEPFALLLERREKSEKGLLALLPPEARAISDAWSERAPVGNFALRAVDRSGGVRITLEREGIAGPAQVVPFAVGDEIHVASVGDDPVTIEVDAPADAAVVLDPERRLLQSRLDDDRDPAEFQLLLDSADVEVSSTEFGFSTLFVARRRYDYRKDLAAAPFITDRGYGLHAGFQLHGGPAVDRNLFRRNLFVYYAVQELDRGFGEKGGNAARAGGRLTGFGLRYNDADAYWFENPSRSHHLRLFADGYDPALGGRYGFVQTGGSFAVTRALRADWVVAAQALVGFTLRTGDRSVPPQGLYSLGGFRSIRGIAADEALDRHLAVGRLELRHLLPVRFDASLGDLLVARRLQWKAFVDAGRVAGRVRNLGDVGDFAVGAGTGVNLFYDFLGFFPTSFYLDLATRLDRGSELQVLFGARQPF